MDENEALRLQRPSCFGSYVKSILEVREGKAWKCNCDECPVNDLCRIKEALPRKKTKDEIEQWFDDWPEQEGYYWYKEEDGIIEIAHFDGEDYEHGFTVCWTEKPLGKEDFKNVK